MQQTFFLYSPILILLVFHFRCPKMKMLTSDVYSSDMLDRAMANIEMIMSTGSLEHEVKRYAKSKFAHWRSMYIIFSAAFSLTNSYQFYITGQQAQLQCQTLFPQRNQHGNLQKRSKLGKIISDSAYLLVSYIPLAYILVNHALF